MFGLSRSNRSGGGVPESFDINSFGSLADAQCLIDGDTSPGSLAGDRGSFAATGGPVSLLELVSCCSSFNWCSVYKCTGDLSLILIVIMH